MKQMFTVIALFISFCSVAQNVQTRQVANFTAISGASGIEIELTQGNENAVSVSASDDQYLEYLKTVVENGVLKIYYDNKSNRFNRIKNKKLKAFVTFKSINRLSGSSGASIVAKNAISGGDFHLDMSSGSSFKGEINASDMKIDQSSGAISKVSGTAVSVKADVSSGGMFTGPEFSSQTCKASASSGGILKIGVSKTLSANVSSGGMVSYKGNPDVEKRASSGGVVSKI